MWQKELNSIVQGAASKAWIGCTCWLMCEVLVFVIPSGDRQALCWGFSYTSYVLIVVVRLEPSVACSLAVTGLVSVTSCGDSPTGPCRSSPGMVQSELPLLPGGSFLALMEHVGSHLNRHMLCQQHSQCSGRSCNVGTCWGWDVAEEWDLDPLWGSTRQLYCGELEKMSLQASLCKHNASWFKVHILSYKQQNLVGAWAAGSAVSWVFPTTWVQLKWNRE